MHVEVSFHPVVQHAVNLFHGLNMYDILSDCILGFPHL